MLLFFSLFCTLQSVACDDSSDCSSIEDHRFSFKDIYINTYNTFSESNNAESDTVQDNTYYAIAQSLGVQKSDIALMLINENMFTENNDASEEELFEIAKKQDAINKLNGFCSNSNHTTLTFTECQKKLKNRIQNEYKNQQFQESMHSYALENQAFVNGTLEDTNGEFFDIIVNLNIIDLILFGDKMTRPLTGSPFLTIDPFKKDDENTNSDTQNTSISTDTENTESSSTLANNTSIQETSESESENSNINPNSTNSSDIENNTNPTLNTTSSNNNDNTIIGYTETSNEGFCINPDNIVFNDITTHIIQGDTTGDSDIEYLTPYQIDNFTNPNIEQNQDNTSNSTQINNTTSKSPSYGSVSNTVYPNNFEDIQLGNIMPPQIKYTGGVYPDLSNISHKTQCKEDEKSFLGGRICMPTFCEELMCIRINMKSGTWKSDTPLRKMNCVECNIDRGNEALSPFIETLGQNTPNQHAMESNFLSAFGNLKKSIAHNVYLKPKRLPFLIYDQASPNDSDDEEVLETEDDTTQYTRNREIYNSLLISNCNEAAMNFSVGEGTSESIVNYCTKISAEEKEIAQLQTKVLKNSLYSEYQYTTQNEIRSDNFNIMLRPFLQQFTGDIIIMNKYLQTIDPTTIRKTGESCK